MLRTEVGVGRTRGLRLRKRIEIDRSTTLAPPHQWAPHKVVLNKAVLQKVILHELQQAIRHQL